MQRVETETGLPLVWTIFLGIPRDEGKRQLLGFES